MMSFELFQIYHLKEMSLSAELFLSCSILQFTFYAISTAYQRKTGFVILNSQVYYIGTLLIVLSAILLLNEDLLIVNSLTSNNFIVNDFFSFASKFVICLTAILFLIIVNVSFRDEPIQNNFEYVVLIIISILGLLLLCSANDLITAYLAIELHSIAFYLMAAFKRKSSYSIESGLKYFIIGALSSALFLFGSAIIYGCTGSLSFDDLQMFLSLISNSCTEPISITTLPTISESPIHELALGSYDLAYDKSLFGLIGISFIGVDFVTTQSIIMSTGDNLIDWCNIHKLSDIRFSASSFDSSIGLTEWFNISMSVKDSWFLPQLTFDSLRLESLVFFSNESIFLNLLQSNVNVFSDGLVLLQHILTSYVNIEVSDKINGLSMLNTNFIVIGFILICVSLFIKLSIAPFHLWSLDVYEGSPNVTTFFFTVIPKMALFVLLMRICYISFYQIFVTNFQIFFFLLAVLSVFVGSLGGLEQRKLKTLLAYSSISHTGYLLLSFSTANLEGMQMMFYYLIIYMVSGLAFWAVYLFLRQKRSAYLNKSNKELGDLILLNESNPMLAFILAITLFSIAGIPPIVGFLAKVGIFLIVVKSSAYLIAVLSILFSVISTFYYIRLVKILYFENILVGKLYFPITTQKALLISILALSLVVLCIDPMFTYLLFYKAVLLI
jgi:NADH:ubiquinone oxidoreductase subunit 2 (subunit N)